MTILDRALSLRRAGPYQIQAAIAALHDEAQTSTETDWPQISALYATLARLAPSPVVELNHAMAEGPDRGLALLERPELTRQLEDYHLFHAARAELFCRLGDRQSAASSYVRALQLCRNAAEQRFLHRRLAEVSAP